MRDNTPAGDETLEEAALDRLRTQASEEEIAAIEHLTRGAPALGSRGEEAAVPELDTPGKALGSIEDAEAVLPSETPEINDDPRSVRPQQEEETEPHTLFSSHREDHEGDKVRAEKSQTATQPPVAEFPSTEEAVSSQKNDDDAAVERLVSRPEEIDNVVSPAVDPTESVDPTVMQDEARFEPSLSSEPDLIGSDGEASSPTEEDAESNSNTMREVEQPVVMSVAEESPSSTRLPVFDHNVGDKAHVAGAKTGEWFDVIDLEGAFETDVTPDPEEKSRHSLAARPGGSIASEESVEVSTGAPIRAFGSDRPELEAWNDENLAPKPEVAMEQVVSSDSGSQSTTVEECVRVEQTAPVRDRDDQGSFVHPRPDIEQEASESRAFSSADFEGRENEARPAVLSGATSPAQDASEEDAEPVSITPPEVKRPAPKPEGEAKQYDSESVVQSWLRDIATPVRSRRRTRGRNFGPEI